MDNGQEACVYAKRYCGDQLVATNLDGRTIPTCFSPDSDTCQAWKTVGCDLRLCGKSQPSTSKKYKFDVFFCSSSIVSHNFV